MLQRCLIALAIAGKAKLVIADEPTTALDAIHRDKAVEQFLHLQEQGCALLIVTHDFDVARHIGGHVLIMKEGRMVEQGRAKEVFAKSAGCLYERTDRGNPFRVEVSVCWR